MKGVPYFIAVEILLYIVPDLVAKLLMAATIARNTSEQINPYSIAVAPDSSSKNFMILFLTFILKT
jgi:hypothetical protein